jgi:hypothetical protein
MKFDKVKIGNLSKYDPQIGAHLQIIKVKGVFTSTHFKGGTV